MLVMSVRMARMLVMHGNQTRLTIATHANKNNKNQQIRNTLVSQMACFTAVKASNTLSGNSVGGNNGHEKATASSRNCLSIIRGGKQKHSIEWVLVWRTSKRHKFKSLHESCIG